MSTDPDRSIAPRFSAEQVLDAMRLVRRASRLGPGGRAALAAVLAELRRSFTAVAIRARVGHADQADPPTLLALGWPTDVRAADESLASELPLDATRVSRLELLRPDRPFDAAERDWLATLHRGTVWAVAAAASGEPAIAMMIDSLAPRERLTLDELLAGASEKQIAARLGRGRHTVHAHVKRLYRRFGVNSRAELLSRCLRGDR